MYKFENISFTKLSGQQGSLPSSVQVMQGRYMCCADCEREPIGFVKEGNKFYICADLVHYKEM
jgi:cell fate regulator YaaT (PSP1 superfamily)